MWIGEELLTREEVDQRLKADGLEPGNKEYVRAFGQRFVNAEMTTPGGEPLFVEVDDHPGGVAVAAQSG
jgi:hypothetical protein